MASVDKITDFSFEPGYKVKDKYLVLEFLGSGWEGEVYKVLEINTGIERAAKFFYPHRNPKNRVAAKSAKKLHLLAHCPIVIQYHTQEIVYYKGAWVTCVVSEYVEGELLSQFLKRQPGGRIGVFQGLHLLHSLAQGLEEMHRLGEYHGDLHTENVMVKRYGLGFELKLMDLHHWGDSPRANMDADIISAIRIFYDAIGGARFYNSQPPEVKAICMGLKKSLIRKKFRSAMFLRTYLENIHWTSSWR